MIKKELDFDLYNEKYLKTTIKSYNCKTNTNFHNNNYQKKALNVFVYH